MTTSNELPEWPKQPSNAVVSVSLEQVYEAQTDWLDYQEARADTAIALLRACVPYIKAFRGLEQHDHIIAALLARIGEVGE